MKLTQFRVRKFRNIIDSGVIDVADDVTCLVGMNEAGKTALLTALNRLNPTDDSTFDVQRDYPRWLLTKDRRAELIDDAIPIEAVFILEADDAKIIADYLGRGVLGEGCEIIVSRTYSAPGNKWTLPVNNSVAVTNLVDRAEVAHDLAQTLHSATDFPALSSKVAEMQQEQDDAEFGDMARQEDLKRVAAELATATNDGKRGHRVVDVAYRLLLDRLPRFFYFSDYQFLPGTVNLSNLNVDEAERAGSTPKQTVRSLLALANTTPDDLAGSNYEDRKAELEAVSNDLTDQVFAYWKQNPNLRVTFDIDRRSKDNPAHGQPPIITPYLQIRVEDTRHRFTNSFDQRSSGFRWFFSFLAAFTEFETHERTANVVVLLDEPGLTLHGRAQADFLHFINERLADVAQVLYTTHSPFMVETDKIQRVRIVEDGGPETGATVSRDVLRVESDSLFPLQAALGYDVVQHLFIGGSNLLVEGASDFIYLDTMSRYLASKKMPHLDEDWRIMPAGGANNIPAFVALVGTALEVSVLIDGGTEGAQRLQRAIQAGRMNSRRLIEVSDVTGNQNSDIEDVFTPDDYLVLYNAAFKKRTTLASLGPGDRIVKRIEQKLGDRYDHHKPAETLLRHQAEILKQMSEDTLGRFAQIFERINASRR